MLLTIAIIGTLLILGILIKKLGVFEATVLSIAGRPLVMLEKLASQGRAPCLKSAKEILKIGVEEDTKVWIGLGAIARVVYLLLAIVVILGDVSNLLLLIPVMTGGNAPQVPFNFDIANALVWFCVPAIFGCLFLEAVGIIPESVRLFSKLGKITRIVFASLAIILLAFSIYVSALFFQYRAIALTGDMQTANTLLQPIYHGLGILIPTSMTVAVWAIVSGIPAVLSILLVICAGVCKLVEIVCSLVARSLEFLCYHLSRGKHTPYQEIGSTNTDSWSQHGFDEDDDKTQFSENKSPLKEINVSRNDPFQNSFVGLIGPEATNLQSYFYPTLKMARADRVIRAISYLDLSREGEDVAHPSRRIESLDPTVEERHFATRSGKGEEEAYSTLLDRIANKATESLLDTKGTPGVIILYISASVLSSAVSMEKIFNARLPGHSILLVTSVSENDLEDAAVQRGFKSILPLWQEGIIDGCLLLDKNSSFMKTRSEETQFMVVSQALVSLIVAHKHHQHNPTLNSVLKTLRRTTCFFGLSSASAPIAAERRSFFSKLFRKLFARNSWSGDISDALDQSRSVVNKALADENTLFFIEKVTGRRDKYILIAAPFIADPAYYMFAEGIRSYIKGSGADPIVIQANGIANPNEITAGYMVQAICLYPLMTPILTLNTIENELPGIKTAAYTNKLEAPAQIEQGKTIVADKTNIGVEGQNAEDQEVSESLEERDELVNIEVGGEAEEKPSSNGNSSNGHNSQFKRPRGRPKKGLTDA